MKNGLEKEKKIKLLKHQSIESSMNVLTLELRLESSKRSK